jgi:hypothetical protein
MWLYGLIVKHRDNFIFRILFLSTGDIYDKTVEAVQALGLDSECVGGGRIKHERAARKILVYGYSQVG